MKELITALKKAQLKFSPLHKSAKNPFFKSNYATLDDCITATRAALAGEGLVIVQPTTIVDGKLYLSTSLYHESGEFIASLYPVDPVKQSPQDYGSALTYARRYCYCSIIGLVAEEDDDGNAASKPDVKKEPVSDIISDAQLKRLQVLAKESHKSTEELKAIIAVFGYNSSTVIKKKDYDAVCEEIQKHQIGD